MSAGELQIEPATGRRALEEFARLPFQVYRGCRAWWPPDVQTDLDLITGRSPLSDGLDLQPWCARRRRRIVARVTAVVNHRYVDHWGEKLGHLIHFEALEGEAEAAVAMLDRAVGWLAERGMKAARSGFAAFLDYPYAIDNYGEFPSFLLRGNPPCYHGYFKQAGFETEKGQLDFTVELRAEILDHYRAILDRARADGIAIRSWREYGFPKAIDAWTRVINAAFERHWGWHPTTREQSRPMLMAFGQTPVADLSTLACVGDKVVGTVFSVPDFSPVLARVKPGTRLSPERGGGTRGALINVGVLEKARGRGIGLQMAARSFLTMARQGMRFAGYTLVLDDNWPSRRTAQNLGARITGNFVSYRRNLG